MPGSRTQQILAIKERSSLPEHINTPASLICEAMDPSSSRIGGHEDWEKRVDEDDDDDALFEQLEEELDQGNDAAGFMSSYRERRLEELKRECVD